MKKLLLLSLTILLFSCEDSNKRLSNNLSINPPSWTQGVWVDEELLALGLRSGYEFKIDDLCQVSQNILSCNKEQLAIFSDNDGLFAEVQEDISSDRYAIDITMQTTTISYVFVKIDNNRIIQKGIGGQVLDNILIRE
jgi:hypothetical protein